MRSRKFYLLSLSLSLCVESGADPHGLNFQRFSRILTRTNPDRVCLNNDGYGAANLSLISSGCSLIFSGVVTFGWRADLKLPCWWLSSWSRKLRALELFEVFLKWVVPDFPQNRDFDWFRGWIICEAPAKWRLQGEFLSRRLASICSVAASFDWWRMPCCESGWRVWRDSCNQTCLFCSSLVHRLVAGNFCLLTFSMFECFDLQSPNWISHLSWEK